MAILTKGTAYTRMFLLVSTVDHISGTSGLAPTVTISKAGAAFGSPAGAVTDISAGWYKIALTSADTATAGELAYHITGTGVDPTDFVDQVWDPTVAMIGVNAAQLGGTGQTGRDIGASVLLSSGSGVGQVVLASGQVTVGTNNDKTGYALTSGERNSISDAFLDRDMSTGIDSGSSAFRTPRQALRILRNKVDVPGGTVYKEDDITASWTFAVTTSATASPITVIDPA